VPRYLHTSIFVNDMEQSIDFYTKKLGLRLLGGPDHHPGNADMAFVGADWNSYIELVYEAVCEHLREQGVKILRGPKKSPGGTRSIAFIEDPNGIPVELLEPRRR